MNESLKERVRRFLQVRRHRKTWEKVVGSLAVVVIFITSYMLILPAITMEKTTYCGNTHHTHTASCYEPSEEILDEDNVSGSTGSSTSATTPAHTWANSLSIEGIEEVRTGGEDEGLAETESESESESEIETESESESETESETGVAEKAVAGAEEKVAAKTEAETKVEENTEASETVAAESETDESEKTVAEAQTEEVSEAESELQSETATKIERASNRTAESETETLTEAESETAAESETTVETAAEQESESETGDVLETESEINPAEGIALYAEDIIDEGDDGIATYADEISLKNYIDNVEFKINGNWTDIGDISSGKIEVTDKASLEFALDYTLPPYTLSQNKKTLTYQLPDGLAVAKEEDGFVYNNGNKIGEYVIDSNGLLSITFYDDYVNGNANGEAIEGRVSFTASVDGSKTDDLGEKEIDFKDDLSIIIKVTDKTLTMEDLQVKKSASDIDSETGTVQYTIVVSSKNGTGSDVTLKDIMEETGLFGTISIKDKSGNDITVNPAPSEGESNFTLILPKMEAGEEYTITYTAQLEELVNGTVTAKNKVKVTADRSDGAKLEAEDSVDVNFEQEILEKTGVILEDGKIQWTITVNKSKIDLFGYTLSDKLNGKAYTGTVTVTPAINGSNQITLPYTFTEHDRNTYTITYITDADKEVGAWKTANEAQLTPSDSSKPGVGEKGEAGDGKQYNPILKEADSVEEVDDETALINWQVTIHANEGDFPDEWTYTDTPNNGQWYTKSQLEAIKASLDKALLDNQLQHLMGKYTLYAIAPNEWGGDGETVSTFQDGVRYIKYKVVFTEGLKKGEQFTFSYQSTAPIDGKNAKWFGNSANINNKVSTSSRIEYKPSKITVVKTDEGNDPEDSKKNYKDLQDGILTWKIKVTVPDDYSGDAITVIENLPEGVDLNALIMKVDTGWWPKPDIAQPGDHEFQIDGAVKYIVTTEVNGNCVKVKLPKELLRHNSQYPNLKYSAIEFEVKAKIQEGSVTWDQEGDTKLHKFNNSVVITKEGGDEICRDNQGQTVKIEKETPSEKSVLSKKHVDGKDGKFDDNTITYAVEVNPDAETLLDGKTPLTLIDELTCSYDPWYMVTMSLVSGSVKVYPAEKGADGKLQKTSTTPLDASKWSYVYNETFTAESAGSEKGNMKHTLTFTIPDAQALIIEYKYKASGVINYNRTVKNSVHLLGKTAKAEEDSVYIIVQESKATASKVGLNIYKVDAKNYALGLNGAEFQIYAWNGTEYVLVQDKDGNTTFTTTNIGGTSGGVPMPSLTYNTAYKLVEVKAPVGYEKNTVPYEFYLYNSDTSKYPEIKPSHFNGTRHESGETIYYPNTKKEEIDITVQKKWFRSDGTEDTNVAKSPIEFVLKRHVATEGEDSNSFVKSTEDIKVGKYNIGIGNDNWEITIPNLPVSEIVEGIVEKYIYYVEETPVANYDTEYSNDYISSGKIIIKNTANITYTLPETGGPGTLPYIAGGLAVMTAGLLYGYSLRRRRERRLG